MGEMEKKALKDYMDTVNGKIQKGWIIAALTDEYIVDEWPLSTGLDEEKVLEIRVFSENGECKLSRSDIGRSFKYREIFEEDVAKYRWEHFDEMQILDIDETKEKDENGQVTATGGGKYKLPLKNLIDAKIKIRYYLGNKDEGCARIEDWRVVEFEEGKING